jgi:hypothetical protein
LIILEMDHVGFPQYVAIMLVKELTFAGFHTDEDANHKGNKVRKVDTLVESLEQLVDSEAARRDPSEGAFQDHLKLEVELKIQVMVKPMALLTSAPPAQSFPHLC